jgi:N-acetylmuramoyl-L-alanine amidase
MKRLYSLIDRTKPRYTSLQSVLTWLMLVLLTSCGPSIRYVREDHPPLSQNMGPLPVLEAPCVETQPKRAPYLIVIDPGHGGEDRGTTSLVKPRYQEKQLTLTTAKLLQYYLKHLGYETKLTRSDDTFIPVLERASMANEAKPALFVSVHYNSAPSSEAHGIEIFYHRSENNSERSKASKTLATTILSQVVNTTQAKSRGVKTGNFAVIRETKMPAVLIEGGFLTNPEEMERIKNPQYIKQIAWGIAQGVDRYLTRTQQVALN